MGHHYIPQHHLRGFAISSETSKIWVYDKKQHELKLLPIKNIAQSAYFYPDKDEEFLAQNIEGPAQPILKKIQVNSHDISIEEKKLLSTYIVSMILRTPKWRECLEYDIIPNEYRNFMSDPEKIAEKLNMTVEQVKFEAEQYEKNVLASESRKLARTEQLGVMRYHFQEMGKYFSCMNWAIIKSNSSYRFLTSDNPVFTSKNSILPDSYTEIVLPLTSSRVLYISSQDAENSIIYSNDIPSHSIDNRNIIYIEGISEVIKQINNRTVWGSDRFLYYHVKFPWVRKLIQNMSDEKLHPIVWTRRGPKLG